MAQTRSAGMSAIPPLLGDKRTSRGEPISVAIDPKRLSSVKLFCSAGFFLFDHLVGEREHGDGSSRPSALAALRLITSSNLAGCTTGRSAGFSRLRMRPT
jgi:hypothetical protein